MQQQRSDRPDSDSGFTTQQVSAISPHTGERVHGVLQVLAGPHRGAIFPLDHEAVTLGRGLGCNVYLVDDGISRSHARIEWRSDGFYVVDLGSRNGTYCQNERLTAPRLLRDGERIALGAQTVLRFSLQDGMERDASRQTLELMHRDPLTQLLNRRSFEDRLRTEVAYSRRHGTSLYLLLIDLDHFKNVNDHYGHPTGDAVLRGVARAIERALRAEDLVGRYGGEEFLVCVRGVERAGAKVLAERLRVLIQSVTVEAAGQKVHVTASLGLVELSPTHAQVDDLIEAADRVLYRAKAAGRNCVMFTSG